MTGQRIYKTADGKHVPEGHPDAALLAYSQHDKPPKSVLDELEKDAKPKKKAPPADKKREQPADKAASVQVSSVTTVKPTPADK